MFDAFGERVLDYTIISCERNPFDRVISAYFWEARDKTDAERQTMLEDRDQFREFLFGTRLSLHGSAALYSLNGFNVADYIVRQEHLAEDLATVAKALDAEGELNFDTRTKLTFRPDASRDKATQKALFEGLEDVVFDKYARTFSALDYGALGTDCGPFKPLEHRQQIKRQYIERLTK